MSTKAHKVMADAELGEHIARRLAELLRPDLDEIIAKLNTVLVHCEEIKGRLPLIEQHYKTCPQVQAREGTR